MVSPLDLLNKVEFVFCWLESTVVKCSGKNSLTWNDYHYYE
jgi:hypothetical protein